MNRTAIKTLSKATILMAAMSATAAQAAVLGGWYEWTANNQDEFTPGPADEAAAGVTATIAGGDGARTAWSSTDGFYGTDAGEATDQATPAVGDGAFAVRNSTGDTVASFTITNSGTDVLVLDAFLFDYLPVDNSSLNQLILSYASGDLSDADDTVIGQIDDLGAQTASLTDQQISDFRDASFSLGSALTDLTLAAGESASFELTGGTAGTGETGGSNSRPIILDNIAITGEVVPEPGSLALLTLGSLAMFRRRR